MLLAEIFRMLKLETNRNKITNRNSNQMQTAVSSNDEKSNRFKSKSNPEKFKKKIQNQRRKLTENVADDWRWKCETDEREILRREGGSEDWSRGWTLDIWLNKRFWIYVIFELFLKKRERFGVSNW